MSAFSKSDYEGAKEWCDYLKRFDLAQNIIINRTGELNTVLLISNNEMCISNMIR